MFLKSTFHSDFGHQATQETFDWKRPDTAIWLFYSDLERGANVFGSGERDVTLQYNVCKLGEFRKGIMSVDARG